jgi:hypothetical protein
VAIPAMNNAVARNRVFTGSELLAAQIREARLAAITRNRPFRIRFDCPTAGAVRMLEVTGDAAIDDSADRCSEAQPNDGPPLYLPAGVLFAGTPPPVLEINGRGQVTLIGHGALPVNLQVSYGSFTRGVIVTATGRVRTITS